MTRKAQFKKQEECSVILTTLKGYLSLPDMGKKARKKEIRNTRPLSHFQLRPPLDK